MAHWHADDWEATALRLAIDDLFVSEDGAKLWAIVDWDVVDISEVMLVHLEEDPLGPFVEGWIDGGEFLAPVIGKTQGLDLLFEVGDVLAGEAFWMLVVLDGELLSRKSESVPAHWVEDVKALHPLHSAKDVSRGITLGMSDVKSLSRWIREHVEGVVFWF